MAGGAAGGVYHDRGVVIQQARRPQHHNDRHPFGGQGGQIVHAGRRGQNPIRGHHQHFPVALGCGSIGGGVGAVRDGAYCARSPWAGIRQLEVRTRGGVSMAKLKSPVVAN